MNKKLRKRIGRYVVDRMTAVGRFIAGLRLVRWFCRLRLIRLGVRVIVFLWSLGSRYIWWPVKRQVRRLLRMMKRREVWFWLAAWSTCAWIAWAILTGGFLMGLMIAMVIAGFYIIISFKSPLAGTLVWLVISPFLTMYIRVKPLQGMPIITGDRYCLLVLLAVYLLQSKRRKESQPQPQPVLHGAMVFFIFAMLLSGFASIRPQGEAFRLTRVVEWDVLDAYLVPFLVYLFARRWITTPRQLEVAIAMMIVVGVYFLAIGIPEHFAGHLVFAGRRTSWGETELGTVRSQGPAESPSEYGLVVIAAGMLALAAFAHEARTGKKILYGAVFGLSMLAVALTLRRSVYLSVPMALAFMMLSRTKVRRAAIAVIAIGGCLLFAMWGTFTSSKVYKVRLSDPGPVYARAATYATAWAMIKDHPLRGVGAKNYPKFRDKYLTGYKNVVPMYGAGIPTPHNAFLRILVDGGLLAFVPYVTILIMMIVTSIRACKRSEEPGLLGRDGIVVFWAFTAAVLQDALTDDIFWFSRYLTTTWFFFFGAIVGAHLQRKPGVEKLPAYRQPAISAVTPPKREAT